VRPTIELRSMMSWPRTAPHGCVPERSHAACCQKRDRGIVIKTALCAVAWQQNVLRCHTEQAPSLPEADKHVRF